MALFRLMNKEPMMRHCLLLITALALASCDAGPRADDAGETGETGELGEAGTNEAEPTEEARDSIAVFAPVTTEPGQLISEFLRSVDANDYAAAQHMFPTGGEPDIFDAYMPMDLEEHEVGNAAIEGACGLTYATVPVRLTFSKTMTGERISLAGTIVLRRVNDVPGSTDAELLWRFDRAELEPA